MEKWRVYIQEAIGQLAFAERCFAAYESALAEEDCEAVFFNLHHFVVHLANVDKILWPRAGLPREAILAGRVDLAGIDFKPLRRLRNHLEHFDERLDDWVKNYDGQTFFDMNIVTGAIGFPAKAYLRALDGDNFLFHGESYALSPLRSTAKSLHERLSSTGTADG